MVREQEPARTPLSPSGGNTVPRPAVTNRPAQPQRKVPSQPQFGQPAALGSQAQPYSSTQSTYGSTANMSAPLQPNPTNQDKYSNLFIGNKGHKPNLHKPPASLNPLHGLKDKVEQKIEEKVHDFFDKRSDFPSHSMRPQATASSTTSYPTLPPYKRDDDAYIIPDPTASQPKPAPRPQPPPMFSTNQQSNAYFRTPTYSDMMVGNIGFATNSSMFHDDTSAATDPFTYMDAAKANDNIKALLEGAFEDEDDEPRTRRRKKQQQVEADDLANKMQDMKVKDEAAEDEEEEDEDDGTREGLRVKLLPHQIDGVSWMQDKEIGTKRTKGVFPKGGILADDMGLGKTIQSIALILANPKPSNGDLESTKRKLTPGLDKGTLVVAPLALIKQWEAEIKDRVEPSHALKVCVHHGPKRAKNFKDLKKYDVVITTYQTLSSENDESAGSLKVGCFGIKWYRIILDEAHSIKNRNAKATKAACNLDAEYRWCLTGTPMQNNLDELQSLIHFLRIKPYEDLNVWREQITKPMNSGKGGLAIKRLRAYLQAFMKRRTKDVLKQGAGLKNSKTSDGKDTGFKIVKRTVEKVEAEFTAEERAFYARLESRTDRSLEQMMAGNKMSYASALVLLMRLRQACNHPKLTGNDLSKEQDSLAGSGSQTPSKKKQLANDDMDSIADMLGGLSVQTKRCDMCQTELSAKESSEGAIRCVECEADLAEQLVVKHRDVKKEKKHKKHKKAKNIKPLREKRKQARRVIDSDDEDEDEKEVVDLTSSPTTHDQHASDSDTEDLDEEESEDDSIYGSSSSGEIDLVASTKIRKLIHLLSPTALKTDKFIIFSFFTSMLDLIAPFLEQAGIKHVKYYGSMPNHLREASLESLRSNPSTRVLLCSLRAGSLGLNLTAASRVVILEPFWNPFVEEQAIDRVHRLNQTRDVVVYKLTVRDTVEERILELQEKKRELANATIEGMKKEGGMKLTLQDMLNLFRHDAESGAGVDMIGMRDGRTLVGLREERGERVDTAEVERERQGARGGQVQKHGERRKEHEIYGRRW